MVSGVSSIVSIAVDKGTIVKEDDRYAFEFKLTLDKGASDTRLVRYQLDGDMPEEDVRQKQVAISINQIVRQALNAVAFSLGGETTFEAMVESIRDYASNYAVFVNEPGEDLECVGIGSLLSITPYLVT